MNRRQFIRNTSLAAAFVGVSPAFKVLDSAGKKKQKIIFVFRGVGFVDGFNAFKSFNLQSNPGFHIQKVKCINQTFSHNEGIQQLLRGIKTKKVLIQRSELVENSSIAEIIQSTFNTNAKYPQVIHMHHTEIGHSSMKLYKERLIEFFTQLSQHYNQELHEVIVTADIGRNGNVNSMGGRDHSNETCLETFSIYLSKNASKLSSLGESIMQTDVLKQKL